MSVEVNNFNSTTNTVITNSSAPGSVSEVVVGQRFIALSAILDLFNDARVADILGLSNRTTTLENAPVKATVSYVDTQDNAIIALITALKAGSAETILSLDNKIGAINAIIGSPVADVDSIVNTVSEILAVFNTYPEGVNLLTTLNSKVNFTDIVNDFTTASGTANKIADARLAKVLKDAADALAVRVTTAENNIAAIPKGAYTLAEYNTLTSVQKQTQGTVADTTAALTTTDANNTVFPFGWQVLFIDGTAGQTIKVPNGTATLANTPFGPEGNLLDLLDSTQFVEKNNKAAIDENLLLSDFVEFMSLRRYHGWHWIGQNGVNITSFGAGAPSTSGTAVGRTYDPTTYLGMLRRAGMSSGVGVATTAGTRTHYRQTYLSYSLKEGFVWAYTFCISDPVIQTSSRTIVALQAETGGMTAMEASARVNLIGIGDNELDANFSIVHSNSTGPATMIPLGANFPAKTTNADIYTIIVRASPNGVLVQYRVINRAATDGAVKGDTGYQTISSNLPAITQALAVQANRSNVAAGAEHILDHAIMAVIVK